MNIAEEKLQWSQPVDGYKLRVESSADAPVGDAQIIFKSVRDTAEEVRRVFSYRGLKPEDKIVHLNEFYPNGRGFDETTAKYMRRGVGTVVLDHIVARAIPESAKAIYVFSMKKSMQAFLGKRGFEIFGPKNCHHIKILEQDIAEA